MSNATEYLLYMQSLILLEDTIAHWHVIREEDLANVGMLRYRLILQDQGLLEVFERFEIIQQQVVVTKYSYHWQDKDGKLIKRWDNAPHHPNIKTHPNHLHDGDETHVLPHTQLTLQDILNHIRKIYLENDNK